MSEEIVENNDVQEEVIDNAEIESEESGEEYEASESEGEVQAETVEELEDELEEAVANGATEEELKSMVKEFELKVNGKTLTKKLDLSDEEAIKRELQKAYAGQQAMQQKAELERALGQRVNEWKNNPWKFFEELGMDADELAELRMAQRLEEMKKDPAELERERQQQELQQLREQLKAKEEREKQLEYERMQEEAAMQLDHEISDALDAHPSLVATPRVIRQIADTLAWAITPQEEGGAGLDADEISVADVLPTVEAELKKEFSEFIEALPDELVEQYFGKKGVEKIQKRAVKKVKKAPKSAKALQKASAPVKQAKKDEPKKRGRIEDFLSVRNR
jgi:hypothetical protein